MERCDSDSWAVGAILRFKIDNLKRRIKRLFERLVDDSRCLNGLFKGPDVLTDGEPEGDVSWFRKTKERSVNVSGEKESDEKEDIMISTLIWCCLL